MLASLIVLAVVAIVAYLIIVNFFPVRFRNIALIIAGVILLLWLVSILSPGLLSGINTEPG